MDDEQRRKENSQGSETATRQKYWLEIYRESYEKIRRYFARRVRCPDDVDDLMQAVFLDLILHGGDAQNPRGYLFTVAKHQLFAFWRRRKKRVLARRVLLSDYQKPAEWSASGDGDGDPQKEVSHREVRATVDAMIGRLSPALNEAIRLRYMDGLRLKVAAARAGCSCIALKKRLERAKHSLGEYLQMG